MHWFWKWMAGAFGPVLVLTWVLVQAPQKAPPKAASVKPHLVPAPMDSLRTGSRNALQAAAQPNPNQIVAGHRFDPYVLLPLPENTPAALRIGDVTGDRRDDIVVVTGYWSANEPDALSVILYRQSATGTLLPPERYPFNVPSNRYGLALGDLNGDGVLEIVVGRARGITIFSRKGTGFVGRSFETGRNADDVGVLDIDMDGDADVIGQTWWDGADLYYGDGRGGIERTEPVHTNGYGYNDLKVADVNGDGSRDVVISSGQGYPDFSYYPVGRRGGGLLTGVVVPFPYTLNGAWGNAIADLNGDGAVDIATSTIGNNDQPDNLPSINLFIGDGHGGFAAPLWISTYDIPNSLETADLDGNGLQDLVVRHHGWAATGIYLQGPKGLEPELLLPAPENSWWSDSQELSVGDVNFDGCKDIAFADANGVVLYLGRNCRKKVHRTGGILPPRRM